MRDNRIDVIRGFAILLLTVTHTIPGPVLRDATGHFYIQTGFFFHAADAFVAFSGLVCGLVYTRMMAEHGLAFGLRRGVSRAIQLFLFNALAFLAVAVVVLAFRSAGIEAQVHSFDKVLAAGMGTIFLYDPIEYFNILNFYILLLVALPIFVFFQRRSALPICLSAATYLGRTGLATFGVLEDDAGPFFVSPLAWQFMFFGGATIGMHYRKVREALPPLGAALGPVLLYVFVTYFMRDQAWIVHNVSSKYYLGPLRIVDLLLVCYVIDKLVRPDVPITSSLLRRVASIGANSLFCFSATLVLCYTGSNFLSFLDGSRMVYLLVLVAEISLMVALGEMLLTHPRFRSITQARWLDVAVAGR